MPSRKARSLQHARDNKQHHEEHKALKLVRKQIKRHRKLDAPRRRDWLAVSSADPEALYDIEAPPSERVMPPRERARFREAVATALAELVEEDADGDEPATGAPGQRGLVVEVSSSLCRVEVAGQILLCGLRGVLSATESGVTNVVAVGDEVIVSEDGHGQGVVEAILPRHSALARPDVFRGHLKQVIAANVDQVLIVASWREPLLWPELIDRYLIGARRNNLAPIICVNKVDLAGDVAECRAMLDPYARVGHQIIYASARTGYGIDALRAILHGRSTALAGLSGVGKSSLLAAVQPGLALRTREVSDHWHLGRHTTTQVMLWRLEGGGWVVDTPGMREYGLSGLRRGELAQYYPEFAALAGDCRFANCSHTREPGCAVRVAAQSGSLPAMRYDSYRKIHRDLPE